MSPMSLPRVPAATARRLLLGAQGLLEDPRRKASAAVVDDLVLRLGFVQVDSINVVERAHHLTLHSRLHGYRPAMLERLLERERTLFEHWTHDASAIPVRFFPQWRARFERLRREHFEHPWWRQRLGPEPEKLLDHVLGRIEREGPLMARDFERPEGTSGAWWGWSPQKSALEVLWRLGRLAIARRINFHKVYDLTERALPAVAALPAPREEEHVAWACGAALERLGVATADEVAGFWDGIALAEARAWLADAVRRGEAVEVEVEPADDGRPRRAWAVPDWEARAAALPPAPRHLRLLSPFDPVLRDRRRALRLFGFDYRFEAFVPAPERRYGYYVLPILEGERLVGRLDPKLDRGAGLLTVRAVWWEPGVKPGKGRTAALETAVARLARFVGAERWELPASG